MLRISEDLRGYNYPPQVVEDVFKHHRCVHKGTCRNGSVVAPDIEFVWNQHLPTQCLSVITRDVLKLKGKKVNEKAKVPNYASVLKLINSFLLDSPIPVEIKYQQPKLCPTPVKVAVQIPIFQSPKVKVPVADCNSEDDGKVILDCDLTRKSDWESLVPDSDILAPRPIIVNRIAHFFDDDVPVFPRDGEPWGSKNMLINRKGYQPCPVPKKSKKEPKQHSRLRADDPVPKDVEDHFLTTNVPYWRPNLKNNTYKVFNLFNQPLPRRVGEYWSKDHVGHLSKSSINELKIVPSRDCPFCSYSGKSGVCTNCLDIFDIVTHAPQYSSRLGLKRTTVVSVYKRKGLIGLDYHIRRVAKKNPLFVPKKIVPRQPFRDFDCLTLDSTLDELVVEVKSRAQKRMDVFNIQKQGGESVWSYITDIVKDSYTFLVDKKLLMPVIVVILDLILIGCFIWVCTWNVTSFGWLVGKTFFITLLGGLLGGFAMLTAMSAPRVLDRCIEIYRVHQEGKLYGPSWFCETCQLTQKDSLICSKCGESRFIKSVPLQDIGKTKLAELEEAEQSVQRTLNKLRENGVPTTDLNDTLERLKEKAWEMKQQLDPELIPDLNDSSDDESPKGKEKEVYTKQGKEDDGHPSLEYLAALAIWDHQDSYFDLPSEIHADVYDKCVELVPECVAPIFEDIRNSPCLRALDNSFCVDHTCKHCRHEHNFFHMWTRHMYKQYHHDNCDFCLARARISDPLRRLSFDGEAVALIDSFNAELQLVSRCFYAKQKNCYNFFKQGLSEVTDKILETLSVGVQEVGQTFADIACQAAEVTVKDVTGSLHGVATAVRDAKTLFDVFTPIVEFVISNVYEVVTGDPYISKNERLYFDKLHPLILRIKVFQDDPVFKTQVTISDNYRHQVELLIKDFDEVLHTFPKILPNRINTIVIAHMPIINDWRLACNVARTTGRDRPRPAWCYLFGPPGQGKSELESWLFAQVHAELQRRKFDPMITGNPFNQSMVWKWFADNEYCDGYNEQFYVQGDDILQNSKKEERFKQVMFLISSINTASYQLHMAALELKMGTFMRAKLFITSSNDLACPGQLNITDPVALYRRRDVVVRVLLDETKTVPRSDPKYADAWICELFDSFGNTTNIKITPSQLVSMLVDKIIEYNNDFSSIPVVLPHDNDVSHLTYGLKKLNARRLAEANVLSRNAKQGSFASSEKTNAQVLDEVLQTLMDEEHDPTVYQRLQGILGQLYDNVGSSIDSIKHHARLLSKEVIDSYNLSRKWSKEKFERISLIVSFGGWFLPVFDWVANFKTWIVNAAESVYKWMKDNFWKSCLLAIGAVGTIAAVVAGGIALHQYFSKDKQSKEKEKRNKDDDPKESKTFAKSQAAMHDAKIEAIANAQIAAASHPKMVKQCLWQEFLDGSLTKQISDANIPTLQLIERNTYHFRTFNDDDSGSYLGTVVFIAGRLAVTAQHTWDYMKMKGSNAYYVLTQRSSSQNEEVVIKRLAKELIHIPIKDTEACVIRFPKSVPMHRNIIKHFPKVSTFKGEFNNRVNDIFLITRMDNGIPYVRCIGSAKQEFFAPYPNDPAGLFWVSSEGNTVGSNSGSLWITSNLAIPTPILGVHSGGSMATSIASVVYQETLLAIAKDEPELQLDPTLPLIPGPIPEPMNVNYPAVGMVKQGSHLPHRTKICPSPIAEFLSSQCEWESTTAPASLSKFFPHNLIRYYTDLGVALPYQSSVLVREEVSPLEVAKSKLLKEPIPSITKRLINNWPDWYMSWPKPRGGEYVIRNPVEIIYGNAVGGVSHIRHDASPGFPFVQSPYNTRKKLFGDAPEKVSTYFSEKLSHIVTTNASKETYMPIYTVSLKDERRPWLKVLLGNTRMFFAGPIDFLVYGQCIFNDYMDLVMKEPWGEWTIGINPNSPMWGRLYSRLNVFKNVIETDAKSWDTSQDWDGNEVVIHYLIALFSTFKVENHWSETWRTDPKFAEFLKFSSIDLKDLFLHIEKSVTGCSQSFLILLQVLYAVWYGVRSGNFMTTLLNCILNSIRWRLVFTFALISQFPGRKFDFEYMWNTNVRAAFHGDDALITVSDFVAPFFNTRSAKKWWMDLFGIELTSPHKKENEEMPLFVTWEVAKFLKRGFLFVDGFCNAPIEKYVIYDMVMWVTRKELAPQICKDNVRTALEEASQHGLEFFREIEKDLRMACVVKSIPWEAKTYGYYRELITQAVHNTFLPDEVEALTVPGMTQNFLPSGRDLALHGSIVQSSVLLSEQRPDREFSLVKKQCASTENSEISDGERFHLTAQTTSPFTPDPVVPTTRRSQLTEFSDVAPTETHKDKPVFKASFDKANAGYAQIRPPPSLENWNALAPITWSHTVPTGGHLGTKKFPGDLLSIPNIAAKLAEYRFYRADIEVRVTFTAPFVVFGAFMIGVLKHSTAAGLAQFFDWRQQLNMPSSMMMSAQSKKSLSFTINRLPLTTYDNTTGSSITDASTAELDFTAIVPLIQSGVAGDPQDVTINVEARFIHLELAGFGDDDGLMNAAKKIIAHHAKYTKQMSQTEKTDLGHTIIDIEKKGIDYEALKKAAQGTVSSLMSAIGNFAPALAMTPLSGLAPFATILGATAPFFKSIGLSKPPTVMAQRPVYDGKRMYMTNGNGLSVHQRLANHPDSSLGDTNFGTMHRPNIRHLMQYPSLIMIGNWDENSARGHKLLCMPLVPSLCARHSSGTPGITKWVPGFMAYYSQFYNWWKGSIKVRIQFYCAQATTAKVRIVHNPYATVPANPEADAADRISSIVEIVGDTIWERTIPYVTKEDWTYSMGWVAPHSTTIPLDFISFDSLQMSVYTPINVGGDQSRSEVWFTVSVSGGPDIDVKDYYGFGLIYAQNEQPAVAGRLAKVEAKKAEKEKEAKKKRLEQTKALILKIEKQSFLDEFSKPFPTMHAAFAQMEEGYSKTEDETDIVSLCHAECWASNSGYTFDVTGALDRIASPNNLDQYDHIGMLIAPFRYWRGSLRYRAVANPDYLFFAGYGVQGSGYASSWLGDSTRLALRLPHRICIGERDMDFSIPIAPVDAQQMPFRTPDLCVELPYHYGVPMQPCNHLDMDFSTIPYDSWSRFGFFSVNNNAYTTFYSVGDDFMLSEPLAPPMFDIEDAEPPPPAGKKIPSGESSSSSEVWKAFSKEALSVI